VSVLDDIRSLEQRVVARLEELRPLIEEYEELKRVAERFGFDAQASAQRPRTRTGQTTRRTPKLAARRRRSSTDSRRRPGGTRATGAERRARVLELIEQRPGITVPEIAKDVGVDPPPLYRVVRKLQEEGVIVKEGKSLRRT
jgi:transposase-like protein